MIRRILSATLIASISLPAYCNEFRLCPSDVESIVRTAQADFSIVHIKLNDRAADRLFAHTSKAIGESLVFVDGAGRPLVENPATIQTPIGKEIQFALEHREALGLQQFLEQGSCDRKYAGTVHYCNWTKAEGRCWS